MHDDSTKLQPEALQVKHQGYRLQVLSGELRGREIEVLTDKVILGKSRQCDVVLPDESVSRQHVEIRREGDSYRVTDKGSTNGTFIGNARVTDGFLKPGDVLGVGKVQLRFLPRDQRAEILPSDKERFGEVLGRSLAMRKIFGVLERVSPTDVTILLEGETGTGKDLVARAIHQASARADGPFVVVDCGAVAPELIEAELFGREDAADVRAGAFELADHGTVFLDEIGELPKDLQPKLLRVLENHRLRRVGGTEETTVDIRIVAATDRGLREQVESGEFREDLYFRLAGIPFEVPSLRARGPEEVEYLAGQFLAEANRKAGTSLVFTTDALATLREYGWPGNVRELRSVVGRLPALCDGIEVEPHHLALSDYRPRSTQLDEFVRTGTLKEVHAMFDRWFLARVLKECGGNVSEAARRLKVNRKTLVNRLEVLGLIIAG